jgi:hypothetical protein
MADQKTALLAPPGWPGGADTRIAILADMLARRGAVPYGAHRRFAREHFMELHGEYYLMHVARYARYVDALVLAPHYVMARIRQTVRVPRRRGGRVDVVTSERWFVVGVDYDADMLWAARVAGPPAVTDFSDVTARHGTTVYIVDDAWFRSRVFGYDHDVVTPEYTVEVPESRDASYRVQGDLVLRVRRFDARADVPTWAEMEVRRYIQYLAADRIAAVLLDHGLSVELVDADGRYAVVVAGGSDGSRYSSLSYRNTERLIKILSTYFSANVKNHGGYADGLLRDGQMEIDVVVESWTYFGSNVGDTAVVVLRARAPRVHETLRGDLLAQFTALRPRDFTRHYGNHALEFSRAIPVSLAYDPPVRPAVLEPVTLYISARDTYIAGRDTVVTLRHREHGTRVIRFADTCAVAVDFVDTHRVDVAHRNRVALRRADALRPPRPA